MSINSEIERIKDNVQTTLNTIAETGVSVGTNSDALPAAASALANEKANKTDLTSHTGNTTVHVTATERTAWNKKLDGVAVDIRKEIAFGSSGKLCIGKFKIYDTQVTVDITATTASTYSGKLVIATQNYLIKQMTVYGDAANTIAPNIFVKPSTTSDQYIEVYFSPTSWSKNVIHIYGNAIKETENVCTSVSSIPDTATQKPVNALTENFSTKSHTHTIANVSGLQSALDGKETSGAAATALAEAKAYTDEAVSGIGGGGGVSSWDDITDKPFISEGGDTLTWDGDTTGLVNVIYTFFLVSDAILSVDDINNSKGGTLAKLSDGTEANITAIQTGNTVYINEGSTCRAVSILADNASEFGVPFPKAGLYFLRNSSAPYITSLTVNGYTGFPTEEKLDPKCLPNGYPYTEQADILPETTVEFDPELDMAQLFDPIDLVGGNTYTVMWNGVEYSCVAQSYLSDGVQFGVAVGDVGIFDTGEPVTGEPFVVVALNDAMATELGVSGVIFSLYGDESATLSISGEVVHKLDEKYLPDVAYLYICEDDNYLYKSQATSDPRNRITNDELRSYFLRANKVFVCGTGYYNIDNDAVPYVLYLNIVAYQDVGMWGTIVVNALVGSSLMAYNTAEYTG